MKNRRFFHKKFLSAVSARFFPGRERPVLNNRSRQETSVGNAIGKQKIFAYPKNTPKYAENGAFSNNIHPFFRAGITNSAELSKNCPQNQSTILSAEKTVKLKKYVFFQKNLKKKRQKSYRNVRWSKFSTDPTVPTTTTTENLYINIIFTLSLPKTLQHHRTYIL